MAETCKTETLLSIISHLFNFVRRFEQYYSFWDANLFILFKIFDNYLGSLLAKLLVLFWNLQTFFNALFFRSPLTTWFMIWIFCWSNGVTCQIWWIWHINIELFGFIQPSQNRNTFVPAYHMKQKMHIAPKCLHTFFVLQGYTWETPWLGEGIGFSVWEVWKDHLEELPQSLLWVCWELSGLRGG